MGRGLKSYSLEAKGSKLPVQIMVTSEQKAEILKACESTGVTLAAFMREASLLRARSVLAGAKRVGS